MWSLMKMGVNTTWESRFTFSNYCNYILKGLFIIEIIF